MLRHLQLSHLSAGLIAVLVGYTSSVAIIFQAIEASGATREQAGSWMMALGLGMGLTTLILSLRHRMPVLTAWSTPGAALLAVGLNGVPLGQAVGAFVFCGVLLTLTGVTGLFERLTRTIPDSLANALLAGVLFQFGLSAFEALATDTALVAAMGVAFVAGKLAFPRYAVPVAFLVGILAAFGLGEFAGTETAAFALSMPIFVMPEFDITVLIGIGLPLYIVTMCSQNMPGVVTLRGAGYVPPVSSALTVTGLASVLLAPFGGYAFNLAAITAAICAGPEADENPGTRYLASLVAGTLYCLVGLCGAGVIALFALAPAALVAGIAGLALLSTISGSLGAALSKATERDAALVTFFVALSGVGFFGIGAPFWALVIGLPVHHLLKRPTAA
ncbi:Inner membrane protein YdcO [Tritonibacter multivorans]|uniref:Inner membrane protein YdcO n=1 Tax=Tritonibacter multivorans TaxID=928856 RepID=A0A0P1G3J0_9RHOB|nr:benzoate/H(+) symporter BenE family transporter [Tritonibacter multivorans]MDA7422564.1 benzoate/H(+) symporter BenE family transporter [Tritonibacter multivorans]CUH76378.1 Inner membrane protein YdcO [Tritonibacter multivorans]SFD38978.1 benzoate membrane transport protein [Tritonibacter multivorans]